MKIEIEEWIAVNIKCEPINTRQYIEEALKDTKHPDHLLYAEMKQYDKPALRMAYIDAYDSMSKEPGVVEILDDLYYSKEVLQDLEDLLYDIESDLPDDVTEEDKIAATMEVREAIDQVSAI